MTRKIGRFKGAARAHLCLYQYGQIWLRSEIPTAWEPGEGNLPPFRMFMSWGEMLLTMGLGYTLLGPKDLPKVAKAGGQLVGRFVIYLRQTRSQFDSFAKENELLELQKEMRQTLFELNSVRHDLQSNMSIMPNSVYSPMAPPPSSSTFSAGGGGASVGMAGSSTPGSSGATASRSLGGGGAGGAGGAGGGSMNQPHGSDWSSKAGQADGMGSVAGGNGHVVGHAALTGGVGGSMFTETAGKASEITYGPPSTESAASFASRTEAMAGGADHIIEAMMLREQLRRAEMLKGEGAAQGGGGG